MIESIITGIAVGLIALALFTLFAIGYKPEPEDPPKMTQEELTAILNNEKKKL